ncbi:MAG: hypothetical protein IJA69_04240 [Clostridia bacterium]|nr:hypothetical protein [Clostridia bacterium]
MRKKRKKFLDTNREKKHFDAFNIISRLLFFAVCLTFFLNLLTILIDKPADMETNEFVYAILLRIFAIILTFVPLGLKYIFKIKMSFCLSTCYFGYLFLSFFLGMFFDLYNKYFIVSLLMNGVSGALLAFFAMTILRSLFKDKQISAKVIFLFSLLVAIALSACWEMFEYICDVIFDMNYQNYLDSNNVPFVGNHALLDTMTDIIANFVGAILASLASALVYKKYPNYINSFAIEKIVEEKQPIAEEEVEAEETIE